MFINFFGKVKNPCEDCVDGECTMNCSGREPSEEIDTGSAIITREKDETVTIRVRSPKGHAYSVINVSWDIWTKLRDIGPPDDGEHENNPSCCKGLAPKLDCECWQQQQMDHPDAGGKSYR